jgi:hypothetical protein
MNTLHFQLRVHLFPISARLTNLIWQVGFQAIYGLCCSVSLIVYNHEW